jgi:hypothetical protein
MKTKTINLYSFDELSNEAKQNAIDILRNDNNEGFNQCYYNEIIESVKAVIELFDLKTGREYTDIRTSHIDDNILQLSGVRLYKYLVNNYYSDLFKPKYIKTIDGEKYYRQFICKRYKGAKGMYTQIFSRMKVVNDGCTLTGVCYDNDILQPIYDFMAKIDQSVTFEDLMNSIESAITKCFNNTGEWINSDEFIKDEIAANNYTFTESGKLENL